MFPPKTPELAVTCVAVLNDLSQVALGVEDGSVILFGGDFNSVRGGIARDVLQRPSLSFDYDLAHARVVAIDAALQSGDMGRVEALKAAVARSAARDTDNSRTEGDASDGDPTELQPGGVTALEFHTQPDSSVKGGQLVSLFVATTSNLRCYRTAAPRHMLRAGGEELDQAGCKVGCAVSATIDDSQFMVLAQPAGVFFFSPEDRGVCYASDLDKSRLAWFRGYLIVASTEATSGRCTVSVYDLKNKFVAFTLVPQSGGQRRGGGTAQRSPVVLDILSEWGAIFVLTQNHVMYQLVEKDTATKLEHLFKIHLFDIAISLAFSNNYDYANIMDIYRMYGDYLYKKNDFDGAIMQYTYTIRYVVGTLLCCSGRHRAHFVDACGAGTLNQATLSGCFLTRTGSTTSPRTWRRCTMPKSPRRTTRHCC